MTTKESEDLRQRLRKQQQQIDEEKACYFKALATTDPLWTLAGFLAQDPLIGSEDREVAWLRQFNRRLLQHDGEPLFLSVAVAGKPILPIHCLDGGDDLRQRGIRPPASPPLNHWFLLGEILPDGLKIDLTSPNPYAQLPLTRCWRAKNDGSEATTFDQPVYLGIEPAKNPTTSEGGVFTAERIWEAREFIWVGTNQITQAIRAPICSANVHMASRACRKMLMRKS